MSAYTHANLQDVDDSVAARGIDIDMEARMARSKMDSEQLGVSYFRYGPGVRSAVGHKHQTQEEAYVVVNGSGAAKLDDDVVDLKQWDVLRVAPPVTRAFEGGPEGMEVIAIGGTRPPDGDGELVQDFWPAG